MNMSNHIIVIENAERPDPFLPFPEHILPSIGWRTVRAADYNKAKGLGPPIDACVINLTWTELILWIKKKETLLNAPLIWWCNESMENKSWEELDLIIDGLLFPSMTARDMQWALNLSSEHYHRRIQLLREKELLQNRLEERKWIERAKAILCEIKHISEAEAYDFLRKQAMNERKRMVDVASSIVKVYHLIKENQSGGKRK
jgi:response regulator NasT